MPSVPQPTAIQAIICAYDWDCDSALRIVYGPTVTCPTGESGGRVNAVNPDGTSFGLFQLFALVWARVFPDFWENWMKPEWNTAKAYIIYERAGHSFSPWSCY